MESIKNGEIRKSAAVMAVELPGISSWSEDDLPAGITGMFTRFTEACESMAGLYGGITERASGERVMAFFGLEDGRDSYASQAVQAALELHNRVEIMTAEQELPEGAALRAGIALGEVIAGLTGSGKNKRYTVLGGPVELATRIQDLAEPGQILVGPEIFRQTQLHFDYRALEPMHLRGQKKPVAVYELTGRKKESKQGTTEIARMIMSEMVGREQEARIVEELIKQLLNGRGSVLNIEGAAGIGKSRLVAEIRKKEITGNVAFFEGRALSEGRNLSFHPIIQIIKSWSGITEEDDPSSSYLKLSSNINRICPEQAVEIIPFVATMMGFTLDEAAKQRIRGIEGEVLERLILKNVRDLLSRAATLRPLVFMVEDAHWADLSSVSFMESLFKLVKNHRLMFINVFRPGYKDTGERLKAFTRENLPDHGREILIKPLTQFESGELIANLVNRTDLPADIRGLIITRSEGNPFFIEEVIRSFIDEGLMEVKEGKFLVTEQIRYANIPETIDKVILSRIERLDEKTKSLLKTASVIGRNFYYKVLEEAAQTIEELDSKLEYLKETQLLNESRHKEDVEFLFKHALAQQATYDSILQKTKKELHLKIARSIEKVFADKLNEFYGILAHHYEKAGIADKMEEYLVKAGDEAFRSAASSEAIQCYNSALELIVSKSNHGNQQQKILDIEEKLAFAYYAQGKNVNCIEHFDRVLKHYNISRSLGNPLKRDLRVLYSLLRLRMKIRSWKGKADPKAMELENRLLKMISFQGEAIATHSPKDTFFYTIVVMSKFTIPAIVTSSHGLVCILDLSVIFPWSGRAIGYGRMLQEFAASVMDFQSLNTWLSWKYTVTMFDYFAGRVAVDSDDEKVFAYSMESGQIWAPTVYHAYRAITYAEMGNRAQTESILHRHSIIAESLENSFSLTQYYRAQQTCLLKFRKLDEVIRNTGEYIAAILKTDHRSMLLLNYCVASMANSLAGNAAEAGRLYVQAEELSRILWLKYYVSITLLAKVFIELEEIKRTPGHNRGEMLKNFDKTTTELVSASARVNCLKTEALRFRAVSLVLSGKDKKALKYFKKSIGFAQWYGARVELARTWFELGKYLDAPGARYRQMNNLTGKDYLGKARSMFEEMDLQWDLQEYERYVEG